MTSGLIGVPLGTWLGARLIKRYPRAHPIICGVGLLISAPFIVLALELVQYTTYPTFILIFIAEVALSLNWAIVADMSLVRCLLVLRLNWLYIFVFRLNCLTNNRDKTRKQCHRLVNVRTTRANLYQYVRSWPYTFTNLWQNVAVYNTF